MAIVRAQRDVDVLAQGVFEPKPGYAGELAAIVQPGAVVGVGEPQGAGPDFGEDSAGIVVELIEMPAHVAFAASAAEVVVAVRAAERVGVLGAQVHALPAQPEFEAVNDKIAEVQPVGEQGIGVVIEQAIEPDLRRDGDVTLVVSSGRGQARRRHDSRHKRQHDDDFFHDFLRMCLQVLDPQCQITTFSPRLCVESRPNCNVIIT